MGAIFVVRRLEGVGLCSAPWSFLGRLVHLSVLDVCVVVVRQRMTHLSVLDDDLLRCSVGRRRVAASVERQFQPLLLGKVVERGTVGEART